MTVTFRFNKGTFTQDDAARGVEYATPLAIELAVHYATMAEPYLPYSEAVKKITEAWLEAGYLEPATGEMEKAGCSYQPTEGLKLYVKALCQVPMPEKQWVIPSSKD